MRTRRRWRVRIDRLDGDVQTKKGRSSKRERLFFVYLVGNLTQHAAVTFLPNISHAGRPCNRMRRPQLPNN
ncbi:hypothetical protein EGY31_19430 [Burkholderia multivorans]|nr:hypothetical protein EGY31_19430 [Burkholderia multivorans]